MSRESKKNRLSQPRSVVLDHPATSIRPSLRSPHSLHAINCFPALYHRLISLGHMLEACPGDITLPRRRFKRLVADEQGGSIRLRVDACKTAHHMMAFQIHCRDMMRRRTPPPHPRKATAVHGQGGDAEVQPCRMSLFPYSFPWRRHMAELREGRFFHACLGS